MGKAGSSKKKKKKNGYPAALKERGSLTDEISESDSSSSLAEMEAIEASLVRAKREKDASFQKRDAAATAALNKLPVFCIGNAQGRPLTFKLSSGNLFDLGDEEKAVFYAGVADAKAQLSATKTASPHLKCDLLTVGLGTAFKLATQGRAMIVPDAAEIEAAGAPPGVQPMGIELPLFACTKLVTAEDGSLPLYMSHAECSKAVAHAQAALPAEILEVSTLGLQSVFEQLVDPSVETTFRLVPPEASLTFRESYLGHGVYMRRCAEPEDAVPPLV